MQVILELAQKYIWWKIPDEALLLLSRVLIPNHEYWLLNRCQETDSSDRSCVTLPIFMSCSSRAILSLVIAVLAFSPLHGCPSPCERLGNGKLPGLDRHFGAN